LDEHPIITPHLSYQDPAAAIIWLSRAFGFREQTRMEHDDGDVMAQLEGPDGGVVMVSGLTADFRKWMSERAPGFREPTDPGWPYLSHTISVRVHDVDGHHHRAEAEGATILGRPTDQPWGLRSYAALDLDGHQWEFTQPAQMVAPTANVP
jgi:uncharacterized glyoxalase superfamily protein PhnB